MTDPTRYRKQINLPGFGLEAQQKLANAKVLIVGMGGLGVPVAQYLNAMGVGTLGLMDGDKVEISNLHRQVIYRERDSGKPKVEVAKIILQENNPATEIQTYHNYLNRENALETIKGFDVIVDASDNFPTRYLINDACVILSKPFVYGGLHAYEGQVSVFNFQDGPTYRCLFPNPPSKNEVPNCNDHGVLGVLPGIIGNFQALEVIKVITGIGEPMSGRLMLYNGLKQSLQTISFIKLNDNGSIVDLLNDYGQLPCKIPEVSEVSTEDFIKTNSHYQIIDVRSESEYKEYHWPGSMNHPIEGLLNNPEELATKENMLFLCQSGQRSAKALSFFQEYYPEKVMAHLKGGLHSLKSHIQLHDSV